MEDTTRPPAYIRRKRKRKLRRTGAQNRNVQATTSRRHYKEDTNRSQLSRKSRKKETASRGKKDNKKPLPRAHREIGHRLRHGRDKVPQHQQKVPGSEQPADHQRLLSNEETPRFCLNHMQRKNEAEQLTAQRKTGERIFPEPRKESTNPNAGLKTEGPSQTSTPKKKKGRPEKVISKADRKT